jgi:hypothetical protein
MNTDGLLSVFTCGLFLKSEQTTAYSTDYTDFFFILVNGEIRGFLPHMALMFAKIFICVHAGLSVAKHFYGTGDRAEVSGAG